MRRIVIVGAGPAGASAGYHLAMRGFDVTLVDRADFPRDKVCGDWLPCGALRELTTLGIDVGRLPGMTPVESTRLVAPSGAVSSAALRAPACCVPRRVLDAAVRARALDAGCATLRRDVRLAGPRRDAWLDDFDVVVDARGAHAGAANAVGLRTYWTVAREAVSSQDVASVRIVADEEFPRGYGWVFPVTSDTTTLRFNVGVGMLRRDGRRGHGVSDFLARFEARDAVLRHWSRHVVQRERPVGCHVGLGTWRCGPGDADALRIGDAANLADPLTGDGIPNALRSGRLVATAIAASQDAADALRCWQRLHAQAFAAELRAALAMRRLLQPTLAKNAAARVLAGSARARGRLHATLFGEAPYRALLRPRALEVAT